MGQTIQQRQQKVLDSVDRTERKRHADGHHAGQIHPACPVCRQTEQETTRMSTKEKIETTTDALLHTAPVDWADRCDRWLTKGAGLENFPIVRDRADMDEVINRLDSHIQHAARLRGYLDARYGSGCGDQGHATGVKWSNALVAKVRKALGFTYPQSEVNF